MELAASSAGRHAPHLGVATLGFLLLETGPWLFLGLERVANPGSNLVIAQVLFESDESEVQDRYRIDKGLRFKLRIAIFHACEPVVRKGVVDTHACRPSD